VEPSLLKWAVNGVRALGMRGINVTVPHKEAIVELLDEVDDLAAQLGAVNTVVNDGTTLVGYNTDVVGFLEALKTVAPGGASGGRFLVAGAGGAARAVVAGLCREGASHVWIFNRTEERAEVLCRAARAWGPTRCDVARKAGLRELAQHVDVLVNASSVGLGETVKLTPFPVDIVGNRHVVIDLVYGSIPTALVAQARAKGVVAIDGKEMLLRQAASSYRLWTGREAPVKVMRGAIESSGS
jgi:shikimate dehydrogenase